MGLLTLSGDGRAGREKGGRVMRRTHIANIGAKWSREWLQMERQK